MKLKEDVPPLFLHVFRSVVWVYSFITFIPWYFLSGAAANQTRAKRIKARSVSAAIPAFAEGALYERFYLFDLNPAASSALCAVDLAFQERSNCTRGADQNDWFETFLISFCFPEKSSVVWMQWKSDSTLHWTDCRIWTKYAVYFGLRATFFL